MSAALGMIDAEALAALAPLRWPAGLPEPEALGFGLYLAPFVVVAAHDERQGWAPIEVMTRERAQLDLATAALQYGLSVFEGLKAYRAVDGALHLFRPREHIRRLRQSARRLCLPDIDEQAVLAMCRRAVDVHRDWVPPAGRGSLYLRPTLFAIEEGLGLRAARRHRLAIVATPCSTPAFASKRLWAERELIRAAPGGLGAAKTAANYAASLQGAQLARARGYDDALWLDARTHRELGEAGAANVFVVLDDRVLTPPLDGTILAGITRDSVIALLREAGHRVQEVPIALDHLLLWRRQDRLREIFGVGTAARLFAVGEVAWGEVSVRPAGGELAAWTYARLAQVQEAAGGDHPGWRTPVD